ncbi:DUF485 domain-containing protein [Nocardiopsis alba]|uniref:DUF485 domain-containing protein n=1 Tax=Nocardiopsis alba TaxID=53437 RepID=A0A7K2IMD3_9ACTN|nr:DUF485 domain-containing protein [Nocardiopsis alba]
MVEYMEGTPKRRDVREGERHRPGGGETRSRGGLEADTARACERVSIDPRFVMLRRRFAVQTAILVVLFLGGYMTYLLLSAYARDFMGIPIMGPINVALLLGIGQFPLTFLLAWAFHLLSVRTLDPLAEELRVGFEEDAEGRVID